jgi:hypothetical protein
MLIPLKKILASWCLGGKTKVMEARTNCPRCHEPVTWPPPGGMGSCPCCHAALIGDPSPVEKEMIRDEMAPSPLRRAPHVGIADMEARIKLLTSQKTNILAHIEAAGADPEDARWDTIGDINRQLREAADRLAEYNIQQEGLN